MIMIKKILNAKRKRNLNKIIHSFYFFANFSNAFICWAFG